MSPRSRRLALPAALAFSLLGLISCGSKESQKDSETSETAVDTKGKSIHVVDLRCEGKVNPLAAPNNPQLSWRLDAVDASNVKQSAWQILVASKPGLLEPGKADL